MAKINVTQGTAGAYGAGELQLQNKAPMDGTLRIVTDNVNTASPLKLSTALVQSTSTVKITTSDVAYIDAEDNSGNNRFTVSRAVASQLVTVDFASVPSSLTTPVGAIRTATDGVSLANVMTFLENGNIGVNTDTPPSKLSILGSQSGASPSALLRVGNSGAGNTARIILTDETTNDGNIVYKGGSTGADQYIGLGLGASFDDLIVTGNGFVRLKSGTGGIQFNGDTAAANALNDYEEGTWTMGVSFGGNSVGVTTQYNAGTYTKIGRQVTVNGYCVLTSKGSSTGDARMTGLPFTVGASLGGNYATASLWLANITFTNQFQAYGNTNATTIDFRQVTSLGAESFLTHVNFANNSAFMVGFTYFV